MTYPYEDFLHLENLPQKFALGDHLDGFDQNFNNALFSKLDAYAKANGVTYTIHSDQFFEKKITKKYTSLHVQLDTEIFKEYNFCTRLINYHVHPEIKYTNFLCSFNGGAHVSRKMLISALHRWKWFSAKSCSKNFAFTLDELDGHLTDYLDLHRHRMYRRFFIGDDSAEFFNKIYSFGHVKYDHAQNIYNLEQYLTNSFLHLVSETLGTSYYPFVTEKFLYSVVTRGLFLSFAQPGWHDYLEKYFGFRKYNRIFDYKFDGILNPVERLVELMSMISKFSVLTPDDWRDLYEMESDTIEFNYDHYFSKDYLSQYENFRDSRSIL